MNAPLVDVWWFWVLQAGWQSAIVGGFLLIVVSCGKRWPAPVRSTLLLIALLKFAVPPFWTAPTGLFSHFAVASRPSTLIPRSVQNELLAPAASSKSELASASVDENNGLRDGAPSSDRAPLHSESARPGNETIRPRWALAALSYWKLLLMFLHLAGALAILVLVAIEFRSIRRIANRSRRAEDGPIRESLERVRGRLGLGRSARILISGEIAAPLATGVWRPTVVLPESVDRLLPRELDAVLVHELTHLRRGDACLVWLQVLLCAAWWFHPVIWLVNRSLRRVREDCCDDAILLSGIATGSEYCDTLLRVAHAATSRRADLLACQMADRLHPIANRLRRIMDGRVRRSLRMSWASMAIVVVLAAVVLPGLGASAQIAPSEAQSGPKKPASKGESRNDRPNRESPVDPFGQHLRESINRARTYLAGTQNQDGSFSEFLNNENAITILGPGGHPEPRPGANQIVGTTSLAILALLSSGMSPEDRVILNGVEFLEKAPAPRFFFTYQTSLEIAALVAAKLGDRDRERVAALVRALVDSQVKTGHQSGMWSYERLNNPGNGDNSNTEFAIMGLSAGEAGGVVIDRDVWARTADHFVDLQNKDGGWGYHNSTSSTGSMTAAAISSLEICRQKLAATQHPRLSTCEIAIKRGLAWQDRYFKAGVNPGQGSSWLMHYWMQIARAGRLTGRKQFGNHEWFREIADSAFQAQAGYDGSWRSWGGPETNPRLATSFILLFLGEGLPGDNHDPTTGAK